MKSDQRGLYDRTDEELSALFKSWDESWRRKEIYGFACSKTIDDRTFLEKDFPAGLAGIYDNNPLLHQTVFKGLIVHPPDKARDRGGKIIVFYWNYSEISAQLQTLGLTEYDDFFDYRTFLTFYHWHKHRRVFLPAIDVPVTLKCTLKCEECNLLIPRLPRGEPESLTGLTSDLDRLMGAVDYLLRLSVLGGEPLLAADLVDYLDYVGQRYRERIFEINVITNGTIVPDDRLLAACRRHGVGFVISDYSEAGVKGYEKRLALIVDRLSEAGVRHSLWRTSWQRHHCQDEQLVQLTPEKLKAHYLRCWKAQACRGLHEGAFYPCLKTWSGEKAGLSRHRPSDFITLPIESGSESALKERLVRYILGGCDSGYLEHCQRCYGFDPRYRFEITAARQLR